jgi:hypothetical protein
MVTEYFKTFSESLRKVEPGYLHTLYHFWIVAYDASEDHFMPADVEKCRQKIYDVMVGRATASWPPRYPSYDALLCGALPKDVEEFDRQAKTCRACVEVRRWWDGPDRDISTYYCSAHMFGAFVLGLSVAYRPIKRDEVVADEPSVEVPAPIVASVEQQEDKGDDAPLDEVSEMWRNFENNLRVAEASGNHNYLLGRVDQVLQQIKAGSLADPTYPPSMFGFGHGKIPKTVGALHEDAADCSECKYQRSGYKSRTIFCRLHKFAAAVVGAKVETV